MKISSIICVALLTVASVDAAAPVLPSPQPSTQAQVIHGAEKAIRSHPGEACRGSGQVCGIKTKSKRVANPVSEALKSKRAPVAAPRKPHGVEACRGSGQVCGIKAKLKRAAEAAVQMDPSDAPTTVTESLKSKRAPVAAPQIRVSAQPSTPVEIIQDADKAVQPHGVEACRGSGQACGIKAKLKRATNAAADALAEPITFAEPPHRFCYTPGGECSNAKREALALAEAAAEAYAIAEPNANPCYLPGGECSNAKREAIAAAEMIAERDAGAFPDSEAGKKKPPPPFP